MCIEHEVLEVVRDMDPELLIPLAGIVFGCTTGMVAIVAGTFAKVMVARGRERTRRELAAYVAEGTLDPDQAVAMLSAGEDAT
jgi:hypothetical protein